MPRKKLGGYIRHSHTHGRKAIRETLLRADGPLMFVRLRECDQVVEVFKAPPGAAMLNSTEWEEWNDSWIRPGWKSRFSIGDFAERALSISITRRYKKMELAGRTGVVGDGNRRTSRRRAA